MWLWWKLIACFIHSQVYALWPNSKVHRVSCSRKQAGGSRRVWTSHLTNSLRITGQIRWPIHHVMPLIILDTSFLIKLVTIVFTIGEGSGAFYCQTHGSLLVPVLYNVCYNVVGDRSCDILLFCDCDISTTELPRPSETHVERRIILT